MPASSHRLAPAWRRARPLRAASCGMVLLLAFAAPAVAQNGGIALSGTRFLLDGEPFPYTGVSFFNAIYNPTFNASSAARREWLGRFQQYGINVLRVWCQWDNARGFVDAGPGSTMYHPDGRLREEHLRTLKSMLADAAAFGIVIELALFSHESYPEDIRLGVEESSRAVTALTEELRPHRNLTFQIWNEHTDDQVLPLVRLVKSLDPSRLVTNSPGFAGFLGDPPENGALDYLTPHTSRQGAGRPWEIAPKEIAYLLQRYRKPVVDDERSRTVRSGGRQGVTPAK